MISMKNKINIAEILKDKPNGIRLYSPIFGKCVFCYVRKVTDDICVKHNGEKAFFNSEGLYNTLGEVMLFPSKLMRDWSKFAWKKGDVLVSNDGGTEVIFDKWYDDTYTNFYSKHYLNSEDENKIVYHEAFLCTTERYSLEDKDSVQTYINTIEERLDGKLNRETLEVKKPKFKDGDIVSSEIHFIDSEDVIVETYIVHNDYLHGEKLNYYAGYNGKISIIEYNSVISPENTSVKNTFLRYATEEEKKQLFSALEKEGKSWDAEKKQIVELKPKFELKPFDKVLCRNSKDDTWEADFFARLTRKEIDYTQSGKYLCVGDLWMYCIPYNEETAHLLGTTDEWKGGEQ